MTNWEKEGIPKLLALQRKQLLKEVREKVFDEDFMELLRNPIHSSVRFELEKKLKELEDKL